MVHGVHEDVGPVARATAHVLAAPGGSGAYGAARRRAQRPACGASSATSYLPGGHAHLWVTKFPSFGALAEVRLRGGFVVAAWKKMHANILNTRFFTRGSGGDGHGSFSLPDQFCVPARTDRLLVNYVHQLEHVFTPAPANSFRRFI